MNWWRAACERDLARAGSALVALNPDEMSPREAMEALYRLKGDLTPRQ